MFDREWIEWLGDSADTVPGEYGNRAFLWPFYDAFRELAFDSPVGEIAATMMGSRTCGLTIDITFIKDPHTKSLTPWHHDQPYYQVQGEHVCGMWIGLDKGTADNGAWSGSEARTNGSVRLNPIPSTVPGTMRPSTPDASGSWISTTIGISTTS